MEGRKWNGYVEKEKEKEEEKEEKKKDMDHGTSPVLKSFAQKGTLKVRTRTWVATAGFGELGCFYKGSR